MVVVLSSKLLELSAMQQYIPNTRISPAILVLFKIDIAIEIQPAETKRRITF